MKKISIKERVWGVVQRAAISSYPAWCILIAMALFLGVMLGALRAAWEEAVDGWREAVALLPRSSFAWEVHYQRWHGKKFINGGRRCK